MNKYGEQAQRHWEQWRPVELTGISDPASFFSTLGEEIAESIQQLTDRIAGPDQPGETTLQKLGRLRSARFDAESAILREALTPEAEDLEEPDPRPLYPPPSDEQLAAWQAEAEAEMAAEQGTGS